jgi:hypothetical protein
VLLAVLGRLRENFRDVPGDQFPISSVFHRAWVFLTAVDRITNAELDAQGTLKQSQSTDEVVEHKAWKTENTLGRKD